MLAEWPIKVNYADGSYRNNKNHFNMKSDDEKILPPIDFWSAISFKRWFHIWKVLNKSTTIFSNEEINSKTKSLKGVLDPFSTKGNLDLLKRAGFKDISTVAKFVCFEVFLAIK